MNSADYRGSSAFQQIVTLITGEEIFSHFLPVPRPLGTYKRLLNLALRLHSLDIWYTHSGTVTLTGSFFYEPCDNYDILMN